MFQEIEGLQWYQIQVTFRSIRLELFQWRSWTFHCTSKPGTANPGHGKCQVGYLHWSANGKEHVCWGNQTLKAKLNEDRKPRDINSTHLMHSQDFRLYTKTCSVFSVFEYNSNYHEHILEWFISMDENPCQKSKPNTTLKGMESSSGSARARAKHVKIISSSHVSAPCRSPSSKIRYLTMLFTHFTAPETPEGPKGSIKPHKDLLGKALFREQISLSRLASALTH